MRWERGRRSKNIEDRRGQRMKRGASVGGGAIIMALVAIFLLREDPSRVMERMGDQQQAGQQASGQVQISAEEQQITDFISVVLGDTEDVWKGIFSRAGERYPEPQLVLFRDVTPTACGTGQAASGPFYCPGDRKLYLDLSFLNQLRKMGAGGDFALAYVIAHEVGHHVQTITGVSNQVRAAQSRASKVESNQIQVRMELQADCYAGVWAHHAHKQRQVLEQGDIEEGMRAAAAVGDDAIQRAAGRRVVKEAFTHGSSEERMFWLRRGLESGDIGACDAFSS